MSRKERSKKTIQDFRFQASFTTSLNVNFGALLRLGRPVFGTFLTFNFLRRNSPLLLLSIPLQHLLQRLAGRQIFHKFLGYFPSFACPVIQQNTGLAVAYAQVMAEIEEMREINLTALCPELKNN